MELFLVAHAHHTVRSLQVGSEGRFIFKQKQIWVRNWLVCCGRICKGNRWVIQFLVSSLLQIKFLELKITIIIKESKKKKREIARHNFRKTRRNVLGKTDLLDQGGYNGGKDSTSKFWAWYRTQKFQLLGRGWPQAWPLEQGHEAGGIQQACLALLDSYRHPQVWFVSNISAVGTR